MKLPTFLVFDTLVANSEIVMHKNFRDRLKHGEEQILHNHTIYRLAQNKAEALEAVCESIERMSQHPFINLYQKDVFEVW